MRRSTAAAPAAGEPALPREQAIPAGDRTRLLRTAALVAFWPMVGAMLLSYAAVAERDSGRPVWLGDVLWTFAGK